MVKRKTLTKTKDVLENVCSVLNEDYEVVELVYKTMLNYMLEKSRQNEIVSMKFPHIGVMYVKKGFLLSKLEKIKKGRFASKDVGRRTIARLEKKIAYLDKLYEENGYLHTHKRSLINNYWLSKGSSLEERENRQNEFFYEGRD